MLRESQVVHSSTLRISSMMRQNVLGVVCSGIIRSVIVSFVDILYNRSYLKSAVYNSERDPRRLRLLLLLDQSLPGLSFCSNFGSSFCSMTSIWEPRQRKTLNIVANLCGSYSIRFGTPARVVTFSNAGKKGINGRNPVSALIARCLIELWNIIG